MKKINFVYPIFSELIDKKKDISNVNLEKVIMFFLKIKGLKFYYSVMGALLNGGNLYNFYMPRYTQFWYTCTIVHVQFIFKMFRRI